MLYRYIYIGGLMGYINIFPKKLQFAAYGQFVLVYYNILLSSQREIFKLHTKQGYFIGVV